MKDQKTNTNREKKQALIAGIQERVAKAKAIVFTNYQGMTHIQIEKLKNKLKEMNAELLISKNTLLKRAIDAVDGMPEVEKLDKPTATLFAYDDVLGPLKELTKSIKLLAKPAIKSGIFEHKKISGADVVKIAALPPKEVLIAQLVGGLKSPIYGLHRALSWNLQKFVMTLKAIENSKSVTST